MGKIIIMCGCKENSTRKEEYYFLQNPQKEILSDYYKRRQKSRFISYIAENHPTDVIENNYSFEGFPLDEKEETLKDIMRIIKKNGEADFQNFG